jgi:hypothetical protein
MLIAVQFCDGYYSLTYTLWFAPLVLVALIFNRDEHAAAQPSVDSHSDDAGRRQEMTVSALGRLVSTS